MYVVFFHFINTWCNSVFYDDAEDSDDYDTEDSDEKPDGEKQNTDSSDNDAEESDEDSEEKNSVLNRLFYNTQLTGFGFWSGNISAFPLVQYSGKYVDA